MSNPNHNYSTLSEAVEDLKGRGYTYEFNADHACLYCEKISEKFQATDLVITAVYRFEGMSDPDDNVVLYALESKSGHKGILIDAYGAYADEHKSAFLKDIPVAAGG
ncbi:phosphoribosylpyrophosphate synthetase [Hufsiella ginkgonis]|uniref:Phosphoribosylpyrophosphate synthetase n=1 Tax=Hufsiella ginkgonis TaxID=2695274 RepID=A0A7K1Y113_9SPHI|nr:phosphoribosylpyrophosphate synthetase [Hufsiella ginkgonis]MXV16935.1 phosphoribosylpyrophosphate synthetase [Hufsiella ginkgonis]